MTGGVHLGSLQHVGHIRLDDALPVSPVTDRSVPNDDKPAEQVGYIALFD